MSLKENDIASFIAAGAGVATVAILWMATRNWSEARKSDKIITQQMEQQQQAIADRTRNLELVACATPGIGNDPRMREMLQCPVSLGPRQQPQQQQAPIPPPPAQMPAQMGQGGSAIQMGPMPFQSGPMRGVQF